MANTVTSVRIRNQPVRFLDVVVQRADGKTLLAGSNLTGRTWNGALMLLDSVDAVGADEQLSYASMTETFSGVSDAAFLTSDILVSGHDSGEVAIWSVSDPAAINKISSLQSHHDLVVAVGAACDGSRVASGSCDRRILVSDVQTGELLAAWTGHDDMLTSVACSPVHADQLVSASCDGKMVLWDLRQRPKPAVLLEKRSPSSAVTCVAWGDECTLALGACTGVLEVRSIKDLSYCRPPEDVPRPSRAVHTRAVTRLHFAPSSPNGCGSAATLASASEDCSVCVTDFTAQAEPALVYTSSVAHSDFVRGLSWCSDGGSGRRMLSCSWDGTLCFHELTPQPSPCNE